MRSLLTVKAISGLFFLGLSLFFLSSPLFSAGENQYYIPGLFAGFESEEELKRAVAEEPEAPET